jgi:hypothetical protein
MRVGAKLPGQQFSQILSENCYVTAVEAAAAIPKTDIPLVTVYEDSNYNDGDENKAWETVVGSDGPCDAAGYALWLLGANIRVNGISSYTIDNDCTGQDGYYWANKTTPCWFSHYGDNPWIGMQCNDHLYSMQVYKYYV